MVFKPIVEALAKNGVRFLGIPARVRKYQMSNFTTSAGMRSGGKKDDSGAKKDDCPKVEPCPKEEKKKEDPCSKEEKKKEEPCSKEEKKKKDPCSKEEKKKEDPCSKEEKKKEDPCSKEEKKKEDPCPKEEKKEDPCLKEEKKEDPCPKEEQKEDPCPKEEQMEDPCPTEEQKEDPCPKEEQKEDPCPKEEEQKDPCSQKEDSSSKDKKTSNGEEVVLDNMSGGKGRITLNRPKQLNTLNSNMICTIKNALTEWKEDKYLIFLKGAGEKAFCAGGDVVAVTADKSGETAKKFFREEYRLDALISTLKVPFASFISGIVMGGGVGISIFGKYRIATETSMFAMPETQIGFFPDVGVSYHLARMPNHLGTFLALTGYRLKGYDLVHSGIATHFINTADAKGLEDALLCDFEKSLSCSPEEIFNEYQQKALKGGPPPFSLAEHSKAITDWFTAECLEEAMSKLCKDQSPFAKETLECIKKMSPLSLKLTYRQLKEAKDKDIFECFNTDYRIAMRMIEHGDFVEGVRARLVDKDQKPKWKHQELCHVTNEMLDQFFCTLPEGELDVANSMCEPC